MAAEWKGWENVFHCEWNPFGQRVLNYYWPKAKSYNDITKTDFSIHRGSIDTLTGGFPCQPYSVAGKQKGIEDERHLWPEMLRAIREIQSTYVVGENVPGLVNWSNGLVFEQVQSDLEIEGYEVIPFILPACGTNAPHRRERIWFIAYSSRNGQQRTKIIKENNDRGIKKGMVKGYEPNPLFGNGASPHAECIGQQGPGRAEQSISQKENGNWKASWAHNDGRWPIESAVCNGNDGVSSKLDGITFSKWRTESIKAGGNAIVPQVALQIFNAIEQFELLLS